MVLTTVIYMSGYSSLEPLPFESLKRINNLKKTGKAEQINDNQFDNSKIIDTQ